MEIHVEVTKEVKRYVWVTIDGKEPRLRADQLITFCEDILGDKPRSIEPLPLLKELTDTKAKTVALRDLIITAAAAALRNDV